MGWRATVEEDCGTEETTRLWDARTVDVDGEEPGERGRALDNLSAKDAYLRDVEDVGGCPDHGYLMNVVSSSMCSSF